MHKKLKWRCTKNTLRAGSAGTFLSPSPRNVVSETITGNQDNPSGIRERSEIRRKLENERETKSSILP